MLKQDAAASVECDHPVLRDDVSVWLLHDRGADRESTYIVGSVRADRYLTVPGSSLQGVRAFMKRLDGGHALDAIQEDLVREDGVEIDVQALCRKFQRAGLLAGRGAAERGDIQDMSAPFAEFGIGGVLRFAGALSPLIRPLFWASIGLISLTVILALFNSSFLQFARNAASPGGLRMRDAAAIAVIGALSVVVHELSHCWIASYWGISRASVRIQLYLGLIPIVGLKFSGLYTLPAKGRLAVWSAGIFANLVVASAALIALWTILPDDRALELTVAINWLLASFNLLPLLANDGYFILSTLLRESNIRVRSWNWIRNPFRGWSGRPSLFVVAYVITTGWLLIALLRHLLLGIVQPGPGFPVLQPLLSAVLLAFFLFTLWRNLRRREE